jgi:hypothetical protein
MSEGFFDRVNLEAGKRRLAGDTARAATTDEVKQLRPEAQALEDKAPKPDLGDAFAPAKLGD